RQGSIDRSRNGKYKLEWFVKVDEDDCGPITVITLGQSIGGANDPLPLIGDYYVLHGDADTSSFCSDVTAVLRNPSESRRIWAVTASFDPPEEGQNEDQLQEPNPLLWPPEYYIKWREETEP